MTKQGSYMIGGLLGLAIVSVVVLSALGKDTESVIGFLTTAIVPTIAAVWAGTKADKAETAAKQTIQNTNGRMKELIQTIRESGGDVDHDTYRDVLDEDPNVSH